MPRVDSLGSKASHDPRRLQGRAFGSFDPRLDGDGPLHEQPHCGARCPDYPALRCEYPTGHDTPMVWYGEPGSDTYDDQVESDHGAPSKGAFWSGPSQVDLIERALEMVVEQGLVPIEDADEAMTWVNAQVARG